MKKTIVAIALILLSVVTKAQDITVQSSVGITTPMSSKSKEGFKMVNFVGVEFKDKIGIEYGYGYSLNNNSKELTNYINGASNSYTAGKINHLVAVYYKTKRIDKGSYNIGVGLSMNNSYVAKNDVTVERELSPYIKFGCDRQLSKGWGVLLNGGFGKTIVFAVGLTKQIK